MHVPSCADELPGHVDPMPMPDTRREAEMLLILLEAGFYPKCETDDPASDRTRGPGGPGQGDSPIFPA
jgi:hypothetical protein